MKIFKMIGVMSLVVFSFYLTDAVTNLAINVNPLMQTIKKNKDNYCTESVNAIIDNNTIIPGIKGKKINEMESFLNMKDFGSFNTNYLIYEYYDPDISIENNKEKIIISGNTSLRQVSILIHKNTNILKYLKQNNIKYSKMINYNEEFDLNENINIENDDKLFDDLDTLLNKKDLNKKICILNYSNIKKCKDKKYYIVNPNVSINNSNIVSSLKEIGNGNIILLDNNLTLENFKILLNKINSNDLKIVYLSEIIEE